MDTVLLRPHHGLCIRFFEGKGYSEDFTKHMAQMVKSLKDNTKVRVTVGCDCICSACPNFDGTKCDSEEHVASFDGKVMEFTGIFRNQCLTYGEFQRKIEEGIFTPKRFQHVCIDCAWGEICHKNGN